MYEKLFSKRGLSLDRLRVFLEVAEAGGIAKAVGTDPVRQSQYSRQLKELAEHFGQELIQRRGKTLKLTPAGERLAQVIRESLLSLHDFANDCANEPVRFCIGAGDSLIQWLLLPMIGKLQREFPRLVLRVQNLRTQVIVSGLQEMSLDFGVLRRDAVLGSLKWKALGQIEYALYIPSKLLPRKTDVSLPWALENLAIATQSSDGQFNQRLHEIAKKLKTRLNVTLECETFPHAMRALQTGDYAAILPRLAARDLDSAEFIEITSPLFPRRQIVLAWNPRTLRLRDAAEQLCMVLSENLRF
ncbi:MAG: LysR family transcriptional regulator [Verrucomicrobiota bacterium]